MNIGIFGDSWALSSFKKLPNFQEEYDSVTFQKLFDPKDFHVVNHAKAGGTNLDTLKLIQENYNYDLLVVFQTDPVRQCLIKNKLEPDPSISLPVSNNLEELCELLLKDFYLELKKIPGQMLLIGGCTKLCFKHVPAGIKTLEESWSELMTPGFNDNYFYWTEPTLGLYNYARNKFGWSCTLADFFEFEKQILAKNHIWQTSDNFSWCHAAEPAYKKMFEKILEKVNELHS